MNDNILYFFFSLSLSNTSWAYKVCSCCLLPWWYCPPVFWLHARKWKYELFAAVVSCSCSKSHPRSAWRLPTALRFRPSSCVSSARLPKGSETLGEQKVQGTSEASCDRSLQLQPVQCRWYCWKQLSSLNKKIENMTLAFGITALLRHGVATGGSWLWFSSWNSKSWVKMVCLPSSPLESPLVSIPCFLNKLVVFWCFMLISVGPKHCPLSSWDFKIL